MCGTKVSGLAIRFFPSLTFRIPIAGYVISLAAAVLRLPRILRNISQFEQYSFSQREAAVSHLNRICGEVEKSFSQLSMGLLHEKNTIEGLGASLEYLKQELADRAAGIEELEESLNQALSKHAEHITGLEENLNKGSFELEKISNQKANKEELIVLGDQKADKDETTKIRVELTEMMRQLRDHKLNILDQQRRFTLFFEDVRKRLPEPISTEEAHMLDAMYMSFEDQFRGTSQDIKERLKVYLPHILEVNAGTKDAPILDLGCGRGEWLVLCKENGLATKGVDINRIAVERCIALGMDAVQIDAIEYLQNLPDGSLGAVTAFHLIEHLSFKVFIRFLDEIVRVLKSGAIAIFETPNPENILVGAYKFYLDPTHRNPLPAPTIKFLVESKGFCHVKIEPLHPYDEESKINEDTELARRFNEYFFSPQDYTLLGYKV